jgi:hypothetical protein
MDECMFAGRSCVFHIYGHHEISPTAVATQTAVIYVSIHNNRNPEQGGCGGRGQHNAVRIHYVTSAKIFCFELINGENDGSGGTRTLFADEGTT